MNKRGPRSKTLKDKHGRSLVFSINENNKINVKSSMLVGEMTLTPAQVRALKNWLNWHLQRK